MESLRVVGMCSMLQWYDSFPNGTLHNGIEVSGEIYIIYLVLTGQGIWTLNEVSNGLPPLKVVQNFNDTGVQSRIRAIANGFAGTVVRWSCV